ncbi:MAG: helix-turn-helix domain-containing protein [Myxococcota bacterium]
MGQPRRELILEAARRLFHHYGPTKTTVADIAREAKVAVGTVYLEFSSKNALLEALSRLAHERVLQVEARALAAEGDPAERLTRALDARLAAFLELSGTVHGPQLFHCTKAAGIRNAHGWFRAREVELFATFLVRQAEAFALGDLAPKDAAGALLAAYAELAPPLLFAQRRDGLRARQAAMHRLVLRGLQR